MGHIFRTFFLGVCLLTSAVSAQEIRGPELLSAFDEIRQLGPNLNPTVIQTTGRLFAGLHQKTDKSGVNDHRDLQYGPDASRQLLDIYTPAAAGEPRPAVVFIHGGGLTAGFKDNDPGKLMYANIGTYFAQHGMVGVNATYRLVPEITYPQGGEDMKAIVDFLKNHAGEYGIHPEQIFFLCASAGCTHTASLLWDRELMDGGTPDIAGAIMLSGAYGGGNRDYYGSDTQQLQANSPMGLLGRYNGEQVPLFLSSAEYDPNAIETGTAELYAVLCNKYEACPRIMQMQDHNHISTNQHINTQDDRYSSQMVEFIRDVIGG